MMQWKPDEPPPRAKLYDELNRLEKEMEQLKLENAPRIII